VTEAQVSSMNLTVIDRSDKRLRRSFPAVQAEAIPQTILEDILRNALDDLLPRTLADIEAEEEKQRRGARALLGEGW